jgi:WD40 repeat protein
VLAKLAGNSKEVWSVAYSPDGRMLASGGNDWTVRVSQVPERFGMRHAER